MVNDKLMANDKFNQHHLDQRTFWSIHNFAKKRKFRNTFSFYQNWRDDLIKCGSKNPKTKQRSLIIIDDAYNKKDTVLRVINKQILKKEEK